MSIDRKEPTVSSPASGLSEKRTAKPAASAQNTNKRPQSRPAQSRPTQSRPTQSRPTQSRPEQSRPTQSRQQVITQKQPSGMLWVTLFIALIGVLAAAYGIWQQTTAQKIINEQQVRIIELEQKLALSDDESTQSLTSLTANVKETKKELKRLLSEVDKLWATRNVNRKAVTDVQGKLQASFVEMDQSLVALEAKLNRPMKSIQQRSSEQELLIQSFRERLSEQLLEQRQTLSTLAQEMKGNASKEDLKQITQKIKAHDEAIQSMDKFRLTVNRDLLTLKQRSASPAPRAATPQ